MGKTFVEDERPCDSCVNVTRYGCVSWNCEYINRDEAIKAWREKNEIADRKTESNSEKPNNYCDDCLYTDTCDSKEFFYACTSKATISKMEQVDKDINVRSKTEPQTMLNDGTLVINVEDATKVSRVLVGDDKNRGDLYYPDDEDEPQTEDEYLKNCPYNCDWDE